MGKITPRLHILQLVWKNYKDLHGALVGAPLSGGYCNCQGPCGVLTSCAVVITALVRKGFPFRAAHTSVR